MTADIAVAVAGLGHDYGDVHALDAIDLQIEVGETIGIIGPDGVGKSTLLSLIAGSRKIQRGTIAVLGHDLRSRRARNRVCPRIAFMPQGLGRNLYAPLSVQENIDFFARLFGERAGRNPHIDELLISTGLEPFRERPAGKLSGGMKQKLGLCCALIHDPDILILDEPTTGVDPLSRLQFWELIERIRARRPGMSVIVATAYMEEAERFDWLAAMDNGRVLATGSAAELKQRTGTQTLEQAFIKLLPEERARTHRELIIPPLPQAQRDIAIEAKNLTKQFGDFTAIDNINFSVQRGEIFGFLGSNGCGKTTAMKMLTGLLPATSGEALLFGKVLDASDIAARKRVGYMSQSFSLYGELSVRQNLDLHARLFHLPSAAIAARSEELIEHFDLREMLDTQADDLPLGIRQRLSLAVAVLHKPEVLILDEPTSGVDPVARDHFWELLAELSRKDGVTIFISTHFMNEAQRCDRISLMHAGRVLALGSPQELQQQCDAATLEDAFVFHLRQAMPVAAAVGAQPESQKIMTASRDSNIKPAPFSWRRLWAYALRETLELQRDPIRLAFALVGSILLMLILGYGITLDVANLRFAVLDGDNSPESREYIANIAGSRYFTEQPPLRSHAELDRRMRTGEVSVAIELPPDYGRDLRRGRNVEIGAWIDGAMPFRGETIRGYMQGLHYQYLSELAEQEGQSEHLAQPFALEMRYRYNQDFQSIYTMVPGVIPVLLMFIPAILMALGIVREKELGSITNMYVSPVTRLEFLLGKQLPYIGVSMISFFGLLALSQLVFQVPLKGNVFALIVGALVYVWAATSFGLFISAFTKTQIAAVVGTMVVTMLPATQFSGLTDPVSALQGPAAVIGTVFPTTYFLTISRGVFTKALGFSDLAPDFAALLLIVVVLTLLNLLLLKKQDR